MPNVNYLAVIVAAVAGVILGLIWYSRFAFGRSVVAINGSEDSSSASTSKHRWTSWLAKLPIALIVNLAAAMLLAVAFDPPPSPLAGVGFGALIGAVWVGGSLGIHYASGRTSMSMWLTDATFHVIRFALMGLIISIWR